MFDPASSLVFTMTSLEFILNDVLELKYKLNYVYTSYVSHSMLLVCLQNQGVRIQKHILGTGRDDLYFFHPLQKAF